MADETHRTPGDTGARDDRFASTHNRADPDEHRHGDEVHSHPYTGPHEHGDDLEYDEAHDPDAEQPGGR